MEVEIKNRFFPNNNVYNVIGEIPEPTKYLRMKWFSLEHILIHGMEGQEAKIWFRMYRYA